jgi:hypothetical protein
MWSDKHQKRRLCIFGIYINRFLVIFFIDKNKKRFIPLDRMFLININKGRNCYEKDGYFFVFIRNGWHTPEI